MLSEGVYVKSSGTTGPQKHIFRTPENLKACNKIANRKSKNIKEV